MKKCASFLFMFAFLTVTYNLHAQGTTFTYQGQLTEAGAPANGFYDFKFDLSNAPSGGSQVGSTVTQTDLGVTNGLFTTTLNFGGVFTGNATWLAISVRSNGVGSYMPLTPLQQLTPTPYAIFANTASNVSGTITAAQLPSSVLTNNEPSVTLSNVTVGGGLGNTADGDLATVPGGNDNRAGGEYSFAAGNSAQADYEGDFVWADSQNGNFYSTANDQFCIRAQGGVILDNSVPAINFGATTKQMLNLYGTGYGIGIQNNTEYFRTSGGFAWFNGGVHNNNQNNSGGGTTVMTLGGNGNLECAGTVYSKGVALTSDQNVKENFTPVDDRAVLAKVASLPISQWNYKNEEGDVRHIGPMAQDFHAAFGLDGADDKHISVVDQGGVALAAIQGLNEKVDEKEARIQEQAAEIAKLKERANKVDALEKQLNELKQLVQTLAEKK